MTATESSVGREVERLRHLAHMAHVVVRSNLAGLTHEDSLIQPHAGAIRW